MTQDFFLGQLRLILVGVLAYCAGAGVLSTPTNTFLGAISVPLIALFGPWLWSIYRNINTKLVPSDSIAVATGEKNVSAVLNSAGQVSSAKVVG